MKQQKVDYVIDSNTLWSTLCESTQEAVIGGQLAANTSEQAASTRSMGGDGCDQFIVLVELFTDID
ncbi:MAG: hypothetical protein AAFW84_30395 [Cyanobacteria bacterium J06635_15]